jgi:predicted Zn-dependent peptidase
MPSVRSVALGFFVGTGSAMEAVPVAGWSHLLEHMIFRGTEHYASEEIDEIFDAMGAELNAGTGKESTSVYSRVLDVHLERAFDVIGEMVGRPRLTAEDLANEREIVVEEIAMYEDDPHDLVHDLLGEAVFGDHPLGRPVIGTRDSVGATQADALREFHAGRYVPGDIVVAAAGSVDHDALVAMAEQLPLAGAPGSHGPAAPAPPAVHAPRRRFLAKDTEQYHVALGAPGIARDDDRRHALRVLDTILGGTSSSRLFQEVREKRGLAYAVYSFTAQHAGTGQVGIYVGTRPDNVGLATRVIAAELERLRQDGVAVRDLDRARDNAKGRAVLALESTSARMNRLGASVLAGLPLLSLDEIVERIDAVTADEVNGLLRELFAPARLSAAGIGPDEDAFTSALADIAPELAEVSG